METAVDDTSVCEKQDVEESILKLNSEETVKIQNIRKHKIGVLDPALLNKVSNFIRQNPDELQKSDGPIPDELAGHLVDPLQNPTISGHVVSGQICSKEILSGTCGEDLMRILPFTESTDFEISNKVTDTRTCHKRKTRKPNKRKRKNVAEDENFAKKLSSTVITDNTEDMEAASGKETISQAGDMEFTPVESKKTKQKKRNDAREKRLPPTGPSHFVAIQITNPQIITGVKSLQQYIMAQNKPLELVMVPLATLHLTMAVMPLYEEEQLRKASRILDDYCKELADLSDDPLRFRVKGLGSFRNNVLFACVEDGPEKEKLLDIAGVLHERLFKDGLLAPRERFQRDKFQLHLTVMKLSRCSWILRKKIGLKSINPDLYSGLSDELFGVQTVRGIQLCSMLKGSKEKNGYYHVEHEVQFVSDSYADSVIEGGTIHAIIDKLAEEHEMVHSENTSDNDEPLCKKNRPTEASKARDDEIFSVKLQKELKWEFHPQSDADDSGDKKT